jgi:Xaa-Pro aminopeptidase
MSENDVWSILHAENIRRGGEWIETRLLSSGPRTNPWYQECGPRIIQQGDILAFDTDLVGAYGYCCDISRSWLVESRRPTNEQKDMYQVAHEQIMHNQELLGPGASFLELSEKALRLPERYRAQRYGVVYHGVGLCDEYPSIRYPEDVEAVGYDGMFEPGMVVCAEAYIGAIGGKEGIKLEDQILITETGYENLTNYPYEACFLDQ